MKPTRIQYQKSTGEHSHIDEVGKKTKIVNLPVKATVKQVSDEAKIQGLVIKGVK